MANKAANVSTVTVRQERMINRAKLCRTLMGGTEAMRKARTTYLPQEPKESNQAYNNRVKRSTLYNAFGQAVGNLTGKLFSKPIVLQENVPEQIKTLLEDVDGKGGSGRDFNRFLATAVYDAMGVGLTHILVDMPQLPKDANGKPRRLSVGEAKKAGHRPKWLPYRMDDVVSWKLGANDMLERIVFKETIVEEDGEWGEKEVVQYRVLYPGRWEIYRKAEATQGQQSPSTDAINWTKVDDGATSLDFIPLVTIYCAKQSGPFMVEKPLLSDLAELNCAHWQSSSDQRHITHVARVPILFGTGWDEEETEKQTGEVGPNQLVLQPSGATLDFVEHTGAAIKTGEDDLNRLQDQMSSAAMEPLIPKTGDQTATAKAIDTAEATSALQDVAQGLKDAVEQLLVVTGAWMGLKPDVCGEVSVHADFSLNIGNPQTLSEIAKARTIGDISRETYLHELQRHNVLSADYDPEEDADLLAEEAAQEMEEFAKRQEVSGPSPPPGVSK